MIEKLGVMPGLQHTMMAAGTASVAKQGEIVDMFMRLEGGIVNLEGVIAKLNDRLSLITSPECPTGCVENKETSMRTEFGEALRSLHARIENQKFRLLSLCDRIEI